MLATAPIGAGRPRLGFTRQEPWIALVIVVILAAVAVPALRATRRDASRRAALRAFVTRVAARQLPRDTLPTGFAGAFPADLVPAPGVHVKRWLADSASWTVVVTDDSIARGAKSCGAFHGPVARPIPPDATRADSVACW